MIVLDEQLLSYGLRQHVVQWYRGAVIDITQLRPDTVIRDEAIPMLLRAARRHTFVIIDVADFGLACHPRRDSALSVWQCLTHGHWRFLSLCTVCLPYRSSVCSVSVLAKWYVSVSGRFSSIRR